jgi:hypothetical protein
MHGRRKCKTSNEGETFGKFHLSSRRRLSTLLLGAGEGEYLVQEGNKGFRRGLKTVSKTANNPDHSVGSQNAEQEETQQKSPYMSPPGHSAPLRGQLHGSKRAV